MDRQIVNQTYVRTDGLMDRQISNLKTKSSFLKLLFLCCVLCFRFVKLKPSSTKPTSCSYLETDIFIFIFTNPTSCSYLETGIYIFIFTNPTSCSYLETDIFIFIFTNPTLLFVPRNRNIYLYSPTNILFEPRYQKKKS